jgi:hypothetical protein
MVITRALIDTIDSEIAALSVVHAATEHRLITKIREFDECDGYVGQGYLSCAHYLNYRIGLSLSAGREKVRVGRALKRLPRIDAAFASGVISYSKVRAMTRMATPENEENLLSIANDVAANALEKLVGSVRRVETQESAVKKEEAREFSCFTDHDGMVVIRGRLLAEEGALLKKALDAMKLPKEAGALGKRFADAIVLMAEKALGSGTESSSSADRYQVVLHVDERVLANAASSDPADGRAEIEGFGGVSAETCRRLACDCSLVEMTQDKDGKVVDVGRRTRVISTPLRRKLRERDHQCRFPGCTNTFADGHHIQHWKDGGATRLENLVMVCRRHHRFVHEYGYEVQRDLDGNLIFRDPSGRAIANKPERLEPRTRAIECTPKDEMLFPRWNSSLIPYGEVVSHMYDWKKHASTL